MSEQHGMMHTLDEDGMFFYWRVSGLEMAEARRDPVRREEIIKEMSGYIREWLGGDPVATTEEDAE